MPKDMAGPPSLLKRLHLGFLESPGKVPKANVAVIPFAFREGWVLCPTYESAYVEQWRFL
jgi:hypothetical protein